MDFDILNSKYLPQFISEHSTTIAQNNFKCLTISYLKWWEERPSGSLTFSNCKSTNFILASFTIKYKCSDIGDKIVQEKDGLSIMSIFCYKVPRPHIRQNCCIQYYIQRGGGGAKHPGSVIDNLLTVNRKGQYFFESPFRWVSSIFTFLVGRLWWMGGYFSCPVPFTQHRLLH